MGLKAVKSPVPAVAAVIGLIALGALAKPVLAQDNDRVAQAAAVGVPLLQESAPAAAAKPPSAKKPKQAAAHRSGKARAKGETGVPGITFETRTSHYFDPLSLTPAPETGRSPIKSQFDEVTNSVALPDKAPAAAGPDDSASTQISSASIEQMGKGRNSTVVVPLFKVLNGLSPGPASQ